MLCICILINLYVDSPYCAPVSVIRPNSLKETRERPETLDSSYNSKKENC